MSSRFWQALEAVPGLAAVAAEWRALVGKEYDVFSTFLRPTQKLAESYPCPQSPDCGCRHAVVHHGADDIVAVCRCEPTRCEPIRLRRTDLVIYEVNISQLAQTAADALGASCSLSPVDALPSTWTIGTYSPTAGFRFPVYLTVQLQTDEFHQAVAGLCASANGPFILLAPTRHLFRPPAEQLLRARNAMLLTLDGLLNADAQGRIVPLQTSAEVLRDFMARVLPEKKATPEITFFPTPPGATWGQVKIQFVDGDSVTIRVGEERGIFHYAEMGMADGRNRKKTKQWDLLRTFAKEKGVLTWRSSSACRENQKRRETLARDLKEFFRIEGDPIHLTEDGKGWQTLFSIFPE